MRALAIRVVLCACMLATAFALVPPAAPAGAQVSSADAVVIVLDVSGSMNGPSAAEPDRSRLDVAKDALTSAIGSLQPGEVNLGLRTFNRCRTDLVQAVAPVDPTSINAAIERIRAGGSTGIEVALTAAVNDLPQTTGERTVLLVSDGQETCGGDPCAAATQLIAQGVRFVVNTVGFQTAGTPAESQLQCIADATGGSATSADDLADLLGAFTRVITPCDQAPVICYAPEVRFHPREDYYPMDPDDFIDGSELVWVRSRQGYRCFGDDVIDDDPSAAGLGSGFYEAWVKELEHRRLRPDACVHTGRAYLSNEFTRPYAAQPGNLAFNRAPGLPVEEGFTLVWKRWVSIPRPIPLPPDNRPIGLNNDPGDGQQLDAPIFAQVIPNPEGLPGSWIIYHMFYGYDPKSKLDVTDFSKAQLGDQIVAHEGDWERIIVVLDEDDEPTQVRFLGHGCKDAAFQSTNYIPWSEFDETGARRGTLVDGTHPVVYVAEGSHASYPEIRDAGPRSCTTDSGAASGEADQTEFDNDSVTWRPWEAGGVLDPQAECWYGFGGAWGRGGDFAVYGIPLPGWLPGVPDGENRGHDSGPAGPHFNINGLPSDRTCGQGGFFDLDRLWESWLGTVRATATGLAANEAVVLSLASVETPVWHGVVGSDGSLSVQFEIPAGFSPGGHHAILRSLRTGDILGVHPINIDVPDECSRAVMPPGTLDDTDGDGVLNECDAFPDDGPFADIDRDGVINVNDNCPRTPNPDQAADAQASVGHACDIDRGVNPAAPLAALLDVDAGPGRDPSPEPAMVVPQATVEPFTNPPPGPTGPYGFGDAPDISFPAEEAPPLSGAPTVTIAFPTEGPTLADESASASTGELVDLASPGLANTGAESTLIAQIGLIVLGLGAAFVGYSRPRPRRRRNRTPSSM